MGMGLSSTHLRSAPYVSELATQLAPRGALRLVGELRGHVVLNLASLVHLLILPMYQALKGVPSVPQSARPRGPAGGLLGTAAPLVALGLVS